MRPDRRMLTYIVIALIVGAALALAVAMAGSGSGAAGDKQATSEATSASLYADDAASDVLAAADPAKEQPPLDKFTAKDPFKPFPSPGASSSATPTPTPTATNTSQPTSELTAKVKVDGTTYTVSEGDKVPGGSAAAFTITGVSSSDVTFKVIDGELKNGDTSFSVNQGEAVKVTLKSGESYDISVVSIGSTGGGSGSSSESHSITVLSVSSQNGTELATFEVDGKTYSDKKEGDVFTTSWGQIEVVSIDVDAQTVTIMHGDQTLTLHAGQVVVK